MVGVVYIELLGPACGHGFARPDGSIRQFDQNVPFRVKLRLLAGKIGLDRFVRCEVLIKADT
jgi:hypothetical protein